MKRRHLKGIKKYLYMAPEIPIGEGYRYLLIADAHIDRAEFLKNIGIFLATLGKYDNQGFKIISLGDLLELLVYHYEEIAQRHGSILDTVLRMLYKNQIKGNHDWDISKYWVAHNFYRVLKLGKIGYLNHGDIGDIPNDKDYGWWSITKLLVKIYYKIFRKGKTSPAVNKVMASQCQTAYIYTADKLDMLGGYGHSHVEASIGNYINFGCCLNEGNITLGEIDGWTLRLKKFFPSGQSIILHEENLLKRCAHKMAFNSLKISF